MTLVDQAAVSEVALLADQMRARESGAPAPFVRELEFGTAELVCAAEGCTSTEHERLVVSVRRESVASADVDADGQLHVQTDEEDAAEVTDLLVCSWCGQVGVLPPGCRLND